MRRRHGTETTMAAPERAVLRSAAATPSRSNAAAPMSALGNQAIQRLLESDTLSTGSVAPSRSSRAASGSRGAPLPQAVRNVYESHFGHDLSRVRVHADGAAAESARAFGAEAFTAGTDIVFGAGRYDVGSARGQNLIAHELTHVVQQDRIGPRIQRKCGPSSTPPDCTPVSVNAADQPRGQRFFFNVNCDDFEPGQQKALEALADPATIPPGSDIEIVGMASSDGDAALNASLSCRRARAAENVLRAKGLGGNIKLVQASGGVPGTAHQRSFRSAEVIVTKKAAPRPDPVFTINGKPKAAATPDTREFVSTFQAVQFMGDFTLSAKVDVRTVQATDADDWQVGMVQTVAGPIHQTCFRFVPGTAPPGHAHENDVFVGNLPKMPGLLVPDRSGQDPVFMFVTSRANLKDEHKGQTSFSVNLDTEDHPRMGHTNSLFNVTKDPPDSRALLIHQHKFGFFLTHVIARQISTGRIIPLHTVEWFAFADVDYDPSTVAGFEPDAHRRAHEFQLLANRAFAPSDVPPAISGKPINQMNEQEGDWKKRCPKF